ncbi:hypothetical protein [Zobellia russellii]|uniref:hypothetical protein n=1 Tax=Zobellia russellii TaxID=248907 RepID=UPI001FE4BD74|nr:hypothetical protein [Zobellia russellii]
MATNWIFALAVLFLTTFLFWKLLSAHFKNEYGERLWKQWGTRLYFWQGAIYTSTGVTLLILCVLKWANVLNF